ncbi:MAG: ABC transporter permease [Armatimonadota bacterium]
MKLRFRREHGLLLLFLVVFLGLALSVPQFAGRDNLLLVLRFHAPMAVLATGMTLVILTGGIDLSIGSIVALSAVVLGLVWKGTGSGPLALAAAAGTGALCGFINGALVSWGRVPPLIVTLATLSVFRGAAYAVGGSDTFNGFPAWMLSKNWYQFLSLPPDLWLIALLFLGTGLYLAKTSGGRAIYAVGHNEQAARLSGVPVRLLKLRLYTVMGLLAGLAAILYAGYFESVRANVGGGYELIAITMVVLGGTSVSGGEGSMAGTALGFLTLILIQNGMELGGHRWNLPTEAHGVVVAILLISALLLDAGFRRRALSRV